METSQNDTEYLKNTLRDLAKRGIRLHHGHNAQLENIANFSKHEIRFLEATRFKDAQ